jgi:branched-chain amino acid transport system permease protein
LGINLREPLPFYYLVLFFSLAGYFFVKYVLRTPFGIALQGIRDNPRRMHALGFNVTRHRILAFGLAAVIAAIAGVLSVWYNRRISPDSIGQTRV